MHRDDQDDRFSIPIDTGRPVRLQDGKRGWRSTWGPRFLFLSAIGICLASLNYTGVIPIPGLEKFARDGGPSRPLATVPVAPRVTPVEAVAPSRVATASNLPAFRVPGSPSLGLPPQTRRTGTVSAPEVSAPADGKAEARALLEGKGIVRVSSAFVLRSEADARSKLVTLRSRAREYNAAYARLSTIRSAMAQLADLEQAVTDINGEIAEYKFQMDRFPGIWRGGILYHGMNMLDDMAYQALKASRDADVRMRDTTLIPRRDTLRRERPGSGEADATYAFKDRREAALGALGEMREAVALTTRSHAELANDAGVQQSLSILGPTRLEPSPEFAADVQELGRFEKSIGQKPTFQVPKPSTPKKTKGPAR